MAKTGRKQTQPEKPARGNRQKRSYGEFTKGQVVSMVMDLYYRQNLPQKRIVEILETRGVSFAAEAVRDCVREAPLVEASSHAVMRVVGSGLFRPARRGPFRYGPLLYEQWDEAVAECHRTASDPPHWCCAAHWVTVHDRGDRQLYVLQSVDDCAVYSAV